MSLPACVDSHWGCSSWEGQHEPDHEGTGWGTEPLAGGHNVRCLAQDSSSDLQLILILNVLLVVVGGFIKWTVVDHGAALGPLGLWPNIYDVRLFFY